MTTPRKASVKVARALVSAWPYDAMRSEYGPYILHQDSLCELEMLIATVIDQQIEKDAKVADDEGIAWTGDSEAAYGGRIASGEIAAAIRQQGA